MSARLPHHRNRVSSSCDSRWTHAAKRRRREKVHQQQQVNNEHIKRRYKQEEEEFVTLSVSLLSAMRCDIRWLMNLEATVWVFLTVQTWMIGWEFEKEIKKIRKWFFALPCLVFTVCYLLLLLLLLCVGPYNKQGQSFLLSEKSWPWGRPLT